MTTSQSSSGWPRFDRQRDDLGAVVLLDPPQHHPGVEPARVEQQHSADRVVGVGLVGGDRLARPRVGVWHERARSLALPSPVMYRDRALYILSVALITAGLVILADVGATLAWQEPTSSLYALGPAARRRRRARPTSSGVPDPGRPRAASAGSHGTAQRSRRWRDRSPSGSQRRRADRPDRDPQHRPRHRGRPGHRHRQTSEGPRPLPRRPRSPASAGRRRSPGTARPTWRPSGTSTRSTAATRSSWRCRTPPSTTGSRTRRSSSRATSTSSTARRLPAPGAHGVPPALQRLAAHRGVRQARPRQLHRPRRGRFRLALEQPAPTARCRRCHSRCPWSTSWSSPSSSWWSTWWSWAWWSAVAASTWWSSPCGRRRGRRRSPWSTSWTWSLVELSLPLSEAITTTATIRPITAATSTASAHLTPVLMPPARRLALWGRAAAPWPM